MLRRLLGELGAEASTPRRAALVAAACGGVAVLVALAWLAVRPVGTDAAAGDAGLFSDPVTTSVPAPSAATSATSTPSGIVVHAAGAVVQPGLYRLPRDARVADLLEAAGGATLETDIDRLNLAAPLADGQRVYVPRQGEATVPSVGPDGGGAGASGGSGSSTPVGPLDLNTATAEQLDALPGVGPATAAAIVSHRERNGRFASVDDLLAVRGIGPAKLEALRDLVQVG